MCYAGKLHKQFRMKINDSNFEGCSEDSFIIHDQVIKTSFKSIIADSYLIVRPMPLLLNFTKHAYFSPSLFWSFCDSQVLLMYNYAWKNRQIFTLPA